MFYRACSFYPKFQILDRTLLHVKSTDISNCEFVCGKAEEVMPELQKGMKFWEESVGVVDPPRAGLREWKYYLILNMISISLSLSPLFPICLLLSIDLQVVDTIRKSKTIERLIYVSCNPEGASKNLIEYGDIIVT